MTIIELQDGSEVEFPDGLTNKEMKTLLRSKLGGQVEGIPELPGGRAARRTFNADLSRAQTRLADIITVAPIKEKIRQIKAASPDPQSPATLRAVAPLQSQIDTFLSAPASERFLVGAGQQFVNPFGLLGPSAISAGDPIRQSGDFQLGQAAPFAPLALPTGIGAGGAASLLPLAARLGGTGLRGIGLGGQAAGRGLLSLGQKALGSPTLLGAEILRNIGTEAGLPLGPNIIDIARQGAGLVLPGRTQFITGVPGQ